MQSEKNTVKLTRKHSRVVIYTYRVGLHSNPRMFLFNVPKKKTAMQPVLYSHKQLIQIQLLNKLFSPNRGWRQEGHPAVKHYSQE